MTPTEEEELWRGRFVLINLVRIGATIVVLVGLYVSQTDRALLLPGLAIAVVAVAASFAGPKWLARKWRTPPAP